MSTVLLLVRAGSGRELLLGIAGVHSARIPHGRKWEANAYFLAAKNPRGRRRRGGDALLVPREDGWGTDARGSARVADSTGIALEGPDADSAARCAESIAAGGKRDSKIEKEDSAQRRPGPDVPRAIRAAADA